LNFPKRLCKTHVGQAELEGSRRSWDAGEERSLRKQRWEIICQRSASSGGYSRRLEILKGLEKLKSKSQS
jgi:hypothetical protein